MGQRHKEDRGALLHQQQEELHALLLRQQAEADDLLRQQHQHYNEVNRQAVVQAGLQRGQEHFEEAWLNRQAQQRPTYQARAPHPLDTIVDGAYQYTIMERWEIKQMPRGQVFYIP